LIERAARDLNIDLSNSWMVGDKKADVEAGFNAGTATALVLTGYGAEDVARLERMPDIVADNLLEAVRQILARLSDRP
jgi:D-glycero-D-manno-heptose 1,7-bisphosphate phosphatase